jgi:hypothetical protein
MNSPLPGVKGDISAKQANLVHPLPITGQTKSEKAVDRVMQQALPSSTTQAKSGWWKWNWSLFSWGGTKADGPVQKKPVDVQNEESNQGALKEVEVNLAQPPLLTSELGTHEKEKVEGAKDDLILDIAPEATEELKSTGETGVATSTEKDQFAATTTKTAEASQSFWRRWGGKVVSGVQTGLQYVTSGGAQVVTFGIQTYAGSYGGHIDKEQSISDSKQLMLQHLKDDSQFVEFFDFTRTLLIRLVKDKIDEKFQDNGFLAKNILPQRGLILDLLEINLAKGFANLAKQVSENKKNIPHYDQQPSLISILSLFSQKAKEHIDTKRLEEIEKKYRADRENLSVLTKKLFPQIEKEPEKQALIKKFIREGDLSDSDGLKLFPDYETATGERDRDIQSFLRTLISLHGRHQELRQLFTQVTENVLVYLFPNKFADMELPSFLQGKIGEMLYDYFVRDLIVDFLQESYEPLEQDLTRIQNWEKEIKARVTAPDLQPVTQAPSALLSAFAKNYIQSDPKVVDLVAWALDSIVNPQQAASSDPDENQKVKNLMAKLSQEQLANWIVESVQAMLHTDDPHLLGWGRFIQQGINNLTLALMAKGAKLVIAEGEKIQEKQFFKELSDRLMAKFGSLQGQEMISDQFWKDIVQDLPLPPVVNELLIPKLAEKAKSLQETAKKSLPDLQQVQKIYTDAEAKIKGYQHGDELLKITEKVSNQIIEQVLEKNIGLVSTFGLGDTVEELFAQYLPGVKINDDLKNWFKDNISSLGVTEGGQSPQSIVLIKQGIQAVLCKALVDTIETNFKDSKDYAAQLLKNIHAAFNKALTGFDASKRQELAQALAIQDKIKVIEEQVKGLRAQMAEKPEHVSANQLSLLEEAQQANIRYIRSAGYLDALIQKKSEVIKKLKNEYEGVDQLLAHVNQVLLLYKTQASPLATLQELAEELRRQVTNLEELDKKEIGLKGLLIPVDIKHRKMLATLLEMSSEELQLVADAVNIEATIQHASKEVQHLKDELKAKKDAVYQYKVEDEARRESWEAAKKWLEKSLDNRQKLDQLSQEVKKLQKELDSHLKIFQELSQELSALIGIDKKENLKLPAVIQDTIWPFIESAKKEHIARLLFEQMTPTLLPALDLEANKNKLIQFAKGDQFVAQFGHGAAEKISRLIPRLITSYKPFAKLILTLMGNDQPTVQDIARMETALQEKMIKMGVEGTTASMLQPLLKNVVPQAKEQGFSNKLAALVAQGTDKGFTKDQILPDLKKELDPKNKKEEQQVERQAQALAKKLNQFLLDRGKTKLNPQDLLDVYQSQRTATQKDVSQDRVPGVLSALQTHGVVDKIKTVIMTPEEMAGALSDLIPGATELHTLVAPQLQDVIVGEDSTFKENRQYLQRYIEGMVMRLLVKIVESNTLKDQDVLEALTRKLQELTANAEAIKDKAPEEVIRQLIDQLFAKLIGVSSQDELEGIPPVLKEIVYEKLKEQAYEQLTPFMLPIIKRAQNHIQLEKRSGSKFMGSLATALSKDLFYLLPAGVKSYRAIADKLFVLLHGQNPTAEQANQFAQEITTLVKQSKDKNVTHHALVEAYARVAKVDLDQGQKDELIARLEARQAKEEIKNVVITPEEFLGFIEDILPAMDSPLKQAFADHIQRLIHNSPNVYQNLSHFVGSYVEGVLLEAFMRIAEKNPPGKGKDSFIVLTENLLDKTTEKAQKARNIELALRRAMIKEGKKDVTAAMFQPILQELGFKGKEEAIGQKLEQRIAQQDKELSKEQVLEILKTEFAATNKREEGQLDTRALVLAERMNEFLIQRGRAQVKAEDALQVYREFSPSIQAENDLRNQFERLAKQIREGELASGNIFKIVFSALAKELNDSVMKDIVGIASPEFIPGLPPPLQAKAFEALKDQLGHMLIMMQQDFARLEGEDPQVKEAAENAKKFGMAEEAVQGNLQILSNDLTNLVMTAVPDLLTEIGGEKMRGVNLISKSIESYLEELARGNLEVAKTLLNYTKGSEFQKLLGDNLAKISDRRNLQEEKQRVAPLLSHLMLVPLNQALNRALEFEEAKGAAFDQTLMANLVKVATEYVKNLLAANALAASNGRKEFNYQDFIAAAGSGLHPAVPVSPLDYQQTIDAIKARIYPYLSPAQEEEWRQQQNHLREAIAHLVELEKKGTQVMQNDDIIQIMDDINHKVKGQPLTKGQRKALRAPDKDGLTLKDLIRQEAEAANLQRQKEAYGPATKAIMRMLFPNGKKDLNYIAPELRGQVWKLYKQHLFPVILPLLTELILDPVVLNQMILSSLEALRDNLLPLHEQSPAQLMALFKKGDLILKSSGKNANEVLKQLSGEELLKMAKQGQLRLKPDTAEPADFTGGVLDEALGELMAASLQAVKLPAWIKSKIISPQGKISPEMQKMLGAVARKQFQGAFVKDKLQLALEKMVERDEKGNYLLRMTPKEEKQLQPSDIEKIKHMQAADKRVARQITEVSIANYIRDKWEQAQARFDALVQRAFPKIGPQIKHALDMVFGFIFFKLMGTILSFILRPIKGWIKEKVYHYLSFDENIDYWLAMITKIKEGQPFQTTHVMHHEDALFKAGLAVKKTVEQFLHHEPVVSQAVDVGS